MIRNRIYSLKIALLLCFLQVAGIDVYAQEPIALAEDSLHTVLDTLIGEREFPVDTLENKLGLIAEEVVDSLDRVNQESLEKLEATTASAIRLDTVPPMPEQPKKIWTPNPTKATWLAVVFPGGGQIYNRKYWKLPIVYGGFAGCLYALNWNNNMYQDYSQAYLDIMDKDPSTNSYYDILPPSVVIDEETDTQYGPRLKRSKDYYRRYRDISVFALIGVYLLSVIDAYVDAELSNFDITPDISMRVEPALINADSNRQFKSSKIGKNNAVGLQCSIRF